MIVSQAAAGVSSFLIVPWMNVLLLLSPSLLLTLTGKSRRPLLPELLGDLVLPVRPFPHPSVQLSRRPRMGSGPFLTEPACLVGPALFQRLHSGLSWVSLALLPPDFGWPFALE